MALPAPESPTQELIEEYRVYMDEFALPPLTAANKKVIAEQLMFGHVIEKRERELEEIGKGLASVSLLQFIRSNKFIVTAIFPREEERVIDVVVLKGKIEKPQGNDVNVSRIWSFFMHYIDELASRTSKSKFILFNFFIEILIADVPYSTRVYLKCSSLLASCLMSNATVH